MLVIIFSLVAISAVALLVQLYFFESHKKSKAGSHETEGVYPFVERRKHSWGPVFTERRKSAV